jgi:hypothetical protein
LFLDSLEALAQLASDSNECLWKLRPKGHYLCHHVDDAYTYRANPRFQALWMDEDFVGKLARLGRACHRKTVAARALQRYTIFIGHLWRERRKRDNQSGC